MKKISLEFVAAIVFLISLSACANLKKTSISNVTKDTYQVGSDWRLVWSDEFKGDKIDVNNWNYQVEEAGRFNDEWQRYTNSDKNAYVKDDCLVIQAIHEGHSHGMNQYTSARLNTARKQVWKYGKISARIKLPQGEGIWPAFWMLGDNINENGGDTPWPQCGEVDILELYGSKDDAVVEANIHYANQSNAHQMMETVSYKLEQGIFADDFHVFELVWTEKRMIWLIDGTEYASTLITAAELSEFHKEFFILLNIAVGGRHAGRPDATTKFPQQMYVDWIRVYEEKKE